ncbi:protein OCTOPUS-like [Typha angustifolia]|uniref:protein OCTOPUS-like n=1 Tax=Typha angustifolia TaxID=59011 RepID=UPI003C2BD97D
MALEITSQQLPPQHPNLHHRLATTCDLHPEETFTGFCASCLRERLAGLDTSTAASATGRKSTSAIKSLFSKVSGAAAGGGSAAFELRRSKSFSCGRGDSLPRASTSFEPQRRSCDVRGRNTLWSLFHQNGKEPPFVPSSSSAAVAAVAAPEVECSNLGFPPPCVPETREEEEEEEEDDDDDDEIRVVDPVLIIGTSGEIEGDIKETNDVKPMKLHIDQESHPKKPHPKDFKEKAGSFWLAASAFSTKWQKWRRKHKLKKQVSKAAAAAMPQEKSPKSSRGRFRDTQSEVAVDAFGRRSCDTDPRFSLDAGRMSFDDPRYSWDEPRASWDGYLIGGGGRSVFSRLNPMLSVVEDAPAPAIQRSDGQIPVEEDVVAVPGGTTQTRDYYLDSSSRRRRSFERSSSVRRTSVDLNETKPQPPPAAIANANAKVTPAGGTEFYHFHHAGGFLDRDFSSNSLRDDISESFESAFQDSRKGGSTKKSKRWSKAWNIWGLIYRRGSNREGPNVVERSFSESWPELRSRSYNANILRSNSSVSARSSFSGSNGFGSMRRSSIEVNGHGKKKKEEFVLERNRSARYSPGRIDNGMLRFYLTPMRNSRRNGVAGKGKPPISSQSMPRSMLRLY